MTVKEMSQLYYLNREIVQLERQLEELELSLIHISEPTRP